MKLRDLLRNVMAARPEDANVAAEVNAVVAANVGERGTTKIVSHRRSTKIAQSDGRTDVSHSTEDATEGGSR